MSGMKDKASGDYAPSRAPYQDVKRFRVVVNESAGTVMIRDMVSGEAGQFYHLDRFEAAIGEFIEKEF